MIEPQQIIYKDTAIREIGGFTIDSAPDLIFAGLSWAVTLALVIGVFLFARRKVRHWQAELDKEDSPGFPVGPPSLNIRADYFYSLILFLIGLAMRLYRIGFESIDGQEYTYYRKAIGSKSIIWTILSPHTVEPHLPLDRVILNIYTRFFDGLAAARVPEAIFGAAAAPLVYFWTKRLAGRNAGLLAALLTAISPFHIYFSQSITPYSLMGLLFVAACMIHYTALEPNGSRENRFLYGAILALGLLCHFGFWSLYVPLAAEVAYSFFRSEKKAEDRIRFWRYLKIGAGAMIPFAIYSISLFYYFFIRFDLVGRILAELELYYVYSSLSDGLYSFFRDMADFTAYSFYSTFSSIELPWLAAAAFPAVLLGALSKRKRIFWVIVAPIALWFSFIFLNGLFTIFRLRFFDFAVRRYVPLIPLFYCLFAIGLIDLRAKLSAHPRIANAVIAAIITSTIFGGLYDYKRIMTERQKADVVAAVEYLTDNLRNGDGLAIGPFAFYEGMFNYYYRRPRNDRNWLITLEPPRWRSFGHTTPIGCAIDHCDEDPSLCSGSKTPRILMPLTDLYLPWPQVLEKATLNRAWLLMIDETPYEYRELLGPGTIRPENFSENGFISCGKKEFHKAEVYCFERAEPVVLTTEKLVLQENDYRELGGFSPGPYQTAKKRRITDGARVNLAFGNQYRKLRLKFRNDAMSGKSTLALNIRAGEKNIVTRLEPEEGIDELEIDLDQLAGAEADRLDLCFDVSAASAGIRGMCIDHQELLWDERNLDCGYYLLEAELVKGETGGAGAETGSPSEGLRQADIFRSELE